VTVSTYTERPHLSKVLGEKLSNRGTRLGHAVLVTGLGGTGKTQLVLRYIEEHEEEYNTILWIDVRSEATARASYERCCRKLGLQVEAALSEGPLQDVPSVQVVLSWLRDRSEDKRWLAVLDNADDMSWDVSGIVPKGKAGTVIVTSQDAQASQLLGGSTPRVKVDAMEPEEAVRLVSNYFEEPLWRGEGRLALVEEITEFLDRLALAIDLAGARVRADVENGDDLATALRQYIADYRRSRDRLLRDEEFACISTYKKTVWTAWETSLASLRKVENSQTDIYPVQLLSFVTLLDRANVQDELFRLASLGMQVACKMLNVEVPTWMQGLLGRGEDGRWDEFSYRASMKLLLRYGLVRSVGEPWKGITMHSLVQWRASVGMNQEQYWQLYLAFMATVCVNIDKEEETVQFRRHVVIHLPPNDSLFDRTAGVQETGLWWMWSWIGRVLWREGRWKEAEQLGLKTKDMMLKVLGEEHPDTISTIANLAATYRGQGRWKEAEELQVKVVEAKRRVLGEEHPDTTISMGNLASTYLEQGRWKEAEELQAKVLEVSRRALGEEHPDTTTTMSNLAVTYKRQGRSKEAEELQVKVLEARRRVLGEEHPHTTITMSNLASTYLEQGRWKEAEELEVKVLEASRRVLGKEHPDTITAIANLAVTYKRQGRSKEAEELQVKVLEARRRVLGEEHPHTIRTMANLASIYRNQGRLEEAEELEVKVLEASRRVLGEEHPDTIMAIANLAVTYGNQGRWKEAEELFVKVVEARRRVLGEEHPDTIMAMANLVSTYSEQGRLEEAEELFVKVLKGKGEHWDLPDAMTGLTSPTSSPDQNNLATDLVIGLATASPRVLGYDHPGRRSSFEQEAMWPSLTSDDDGDNDQDVDQAVHSDDDGGVAIL
jgi:tetratricopeptide (TPR) repeat protein